MPPVKIDVTLNEGDVIKVGKLELKVWHTPGHTAGQIAFKMGNLLFSGDNMYKDGCVGVIDAHHGSNLPDFIRSLERILADDADFLLPSHGPVFRRDAKIVQKAIDRLKGYQYMADFGTCAIGWPLLERVGVGRDRRADAEVLSAGAGGSARAGRTAASVPAGAGLRGGTGFVVVGTRRRGYDGGHDPSLSPTVPALGTVTCPRSSVSSSAEAEAPASSR